MLTVVRRELLSALRRPLVRWAAALLQLGLLLFMVAIWPDGQEAVSPEFLARLVIYDFFEKVLILLLAIAPLVTAMAFVQEREGSTLQLLRLTRLSPWQIVLGKLISAVGVMLLLLISTLPYTVLLLGMGGVSLYAIGVLYVFLVATIIYTGLIGMAISLLVARPVITIIATYFVLIMMNMILPSVQLGLQYYELAKNPGLGYTMRWPPDLEDLYSTPQLETLHFYIIDLFSPFSVFLNFRFVQLRRLAPYFFAGQQNQPAGDFVMVGHFLALSAVSSVALLAWCVARLEALSPRSGRAQTGALNQLQGKLSRNGAKLSFIGAMAVSMVFGAFLYAFDSDRPRQHAIVVMTLAGVFAGVAGADAISRERHRNTLSTLAATGIDAGRFLRWKLQPPVIAGLLLWLGTGAGVLLGAGLGVFPINFIRGLSYHDFVALGLCMLGGGLVAGIIGLIASFLAPSLGAARFTTFAILGVLMMHWRSQATPFDTRTFDLIQSGDFGLWAYPLFFIAGLKSAVSIILTTINPFRWIDLAFQRGSLGLDFEPTVWGLRTSLWLSTVAALATAMLVVGWASRRLERRYHFAPRES